MNLEKRAGMLPYYIHPDGKIEFLLMVPVNPKLSSKPQISKGWIDEGEDMLQAAVREAKEELGLKKKNMKRNPLHIGIWDKTDIFMVEVRSKEKFKKIDKEEVKKTIWMTIDEYRKDGRKSQRAVLELTNIIAKKLMDLEDEY